jgi:hypothetical protein
MMYRTWDGKTKIWITYIILLQLDSHKNSVVSQLISMPVVLIPPPIKQWYKWNIVERGIKNHKSTVPISYIMAASVKKTLCW